VNALPAFVLPERLEAREPPEVRGLARDEVRMLVAEREAGRLTHARVRDLPDVLQPGDLLVVNTSATLPAALDARGAGGEALVLHLSTRLPEGWLVELRRGDAPFRDARAGRRLALPGGAEAQLCAPWLGGSRLWLARLALPEPVVPYLHRHGRPIRYPHTRGAWPLRDYQTVFATEPGSAEMPSAGRPFTPALVTALVARGVALAPLVLHTGVSSLEAGEAPYPEWFRLPPATARLVNATRAGGGRVIAVGTTVVRALESAAAAGGAVAPAEGLTRLVVTPQRGVRAVDGLLTGWHDPDASHLLLLQAVAGPALVERSYREALAAGYLWHEFGDAHLLLP
jgi:S-adenosylmethionine:tRNA ribosyltransferase-isomerase